jgi:membrane protein YdbS with pleckstrin-like domain
MRCEATVTFKRRQTGNDSSMTCKQCGADVDAGAAFCQACGATLHPSTPEPAGVKTKSGSEASVVADDAEQVLWEGRFSHRAMIGGWIAAAAITLAVFIIAAMSSLSGQGWLLALLLIAIVWFVILVRLVYRRMGIHYLLTNQRLIHERGILWRRTDRIEAIDVDDVQFSQGPIERLAGVGTIHVISSDQSTPQFDLVGIEDVSRVATLIDEVRRKERRKRAVHIESL